MALPKGGFSDVDGTNSDIFRAEVGREIVDFEADMRCELKRGIYCGIRTNTRYHLRVAPL